MRFPKELCSHRSTQSDIDMLSSWRLSLRTSLVVDGPELRSWFSPLPLLSNISLSPRNDLLLLFLVRTRLSLSQVSQKLSRKHLLWGSSERFLSEICFVEAFCDWAEDDDLWWGIKRWGEVYLEKFDWYIGKRSLAVQWSYSLVYPQLLDIESMHSYNEAAKQLN